MVPAELPQSPQTVVDRTVPFTLAATVGVAAVMIAALWPAPSAPADALALAAFADEVTGREQLIVPLGKVALSGVSEGAESWLELRLQTPPPAEAGPLSAGVTLLVNAEVPELLDAPAEARIKVASVEGPVPLRRVEIEDHGTVTSGLYGDIPWGLVIGLSTGVPASLRLGERQITFPTTTQAQVLKALRRARAEGREFATFGVDITSDHPSSPPAAPAQATGPAQPAPSASE